MQVSANGIQIEVQDNGAEDAPVVLLIMGLGMQLTGWPELWLSSLQAAGFRVVRFDNRDSGYSTSMDAMGVPHMLWAGLKHKLGWRQKPPYTLQDMARDALGVLDALGVARAHVIGVSMGGMIAQRMALMAPQRLFSLVSIMSTSGASGLPDPDPVVLKHMFTPAKPGIDGAIAHNVRLIQLIASPAHPLDEAVLRQQIESAVRRAHRPAGVLRQTVAVMADTGRAELLSSVAVPTLVVHGDSDRMVPLACGQDTVRRIPGAMWHVVSGMGHDLSPWASQRMLSAVLPFLKGHTPR